MGYAKEVGISFDNVREKNVMQLRKLNAAIFPIDYNEKYYADALASGDFTKLAYYGDICVGSVACRLERKEVKGMRLYIMTLGVLVPYRGYGIGSKLLAHVLELCQKDPKIEEIYLHVQTNNEKAIHFYNKFEFEITDRIENYYANIEPSDSYVLLRKFSPPTKAK